MAPCAGVGEMQGVELQFYFRQHTENPPLVAEQGRQNWYLFLVCGDLPFFSLVFLGFFEIQSRRCSCSLLPSGLGQAPAGPAQGSGQGRTVCWSCRAASGVLLVWDWWPRQWDKEVCSSPLSVKHPQFSQLCSSLSSGRHRNVLTMTFFCFIFSSLKAIAFWLLSV